MQNSGFISELDNAANTTFSAFQIFTVSIGEIFGIKFLRISDNKSKPFLLKIIFPNSNIKTRCIIIFKN